MLLKIPTHTVRLLLEADWVAATRRVDEAKKGDETVNTEGMEGDQEFEDGARLLTAAGADAMTHRLQRQPKEPTKVE